MKNFVRLSSSSVPKYDFLGLYCLDTRYRQNIDKKGERSDEWYIHGSNHSWTDMDEGSLWFHSQSVVVGYPLSKSIPLSYVYIVICRFHSIFESKSKRKILRKCQKKKNKTQNCRLIDWIHLFDNNNFYVCNNFHSWLAYILFLLRPKLRRFSFAEYSFCTSIAYNSITR